MNERRLKSELERWYHRVNTPDFIPGDPVQFPHRYKKREDIEIIAILAATIAWGRRDLILRSCEKICALLGPRPGAFIMRPGNTDFPGLEEGCIHRTFFASDLRYFCRGFQACFAKYGNLEAIFSSGADIWDGIRLFREEMAAANGGVYSKHIANPDSSSACKRLNLALRWLVRREGPVDLGLWKRIDPGSLYIPLDVHVGRTARRLGLLDAQRLSNDRKAVIQLTETLRRFCPDDPLRYDFALFGMGIGP
jgi:uncharacterized protein (TIGR02757 family)